MKLTEPRYDQIQECKCYRIHDMTDVKVIVDLGANRGHFADFAREMYPDAELICYEPDPANFAELVKRVPGAVNCAVGGDYGRVTFEAAGDESSHIATDHPGEVINNPITADVVPLSHILRHLDRVDILKIDIEGAEGELLLNASEEDMEKVRYLTMEWHIWQDNEVQDRVLEKLWRTHVVALRVRPPYADIWYCWLREPDDAYRRKLARLEAETA